MSGESAEGPSGPGKRVDARRNTSAILQAAARLLARDPSTTIQQIADEAGVVRLTVYRRYRNRDALRTAVFEAAAAEVQKAVETALARELDPEATLRLIIVEMAATARRYPLIVIGDDLKPMPGQRGRPASPKNSRMLHRAVSDLILRGQAEGAIRADLPSALFPLAIVGTLNTVTRFAAALSIDEERIGEYVADLVLAGARGPAPAIR